MNAANATHYSQPLQPRVGRLSTPLQTTTTTTKPPAPDNVSLVDARTQQGRGGGREQEGGYTGNETKTMVKIWVWANRSKNDFKGGEFRSVLKTKQVYTILFCTGPTTSLWSSSNVVAGGGGGSGSRGRITLSSPVAVGGYSGWL
jgi:hypothetical protein